MRMPRRILDRLAAFARRTALGREPDVVIGGMEDPYLFRWFLIPRNPVFNIYLHRFLRSDDDRALHDHPWANCSILLAGNYTEHVIEQGGIHRKIRRNPGDVKFRLSGKYAHRLELTDSFCTTIFVTGPRYRQWGFHCAEKGWVHWKDFTAEGDSGRVGKGCDA